MRKFLLLTTALLVLGLGRAPVFAEPTADQLIDAYKYGIDLYQSEKYEQAKMIFKRVALHSAKEPGINANSIYFYSQCAFRTEDYTSCVKALYVLAKKWPNSAAIKNGYVKRFCSFLIGQVAGLQTNWDYLRFKERVDSSGNNVWKESIPVGMKIKRVNFKLGFGLLRVLNTVHPSDPETAAAKQKLEAMLNAPITMIWMDEKAPPDQYGHPTGMISFFSLNEKKDFSKVICERMFYDWSCDRLYMFLDMNADVRNSKVRFVAKTEYQPVVVMAGMAAPPPAKVDPSRIFTLARLFEVSGYNPWNDSYKNAIETSLTEELSF